GSGTKTLDQSIAVKGNWVNNTTFSANGNRSVVLNGASSQTISGTSSPIPFYNLEIDNSTAGNAIVLSTPVSVSNVLTLTDGHIITTSTNILSMGSGGSVTLNCTPQDSSFIKGPMKHTVNVSTSTTKTYPVGKADSYRRVDLTIDQTVNTSTDYTAEVFNSSATSLGYTLPGTVDRVSSLRYFQIDRSAATALDAAQVRLYFGCSGINDRVTDATNLAIVKDNGAGAWLDLSGTTTSSVCSSPDLSGSILSGTFTSFSKFAFGNKSGGINPLPVEFLSVEAVQQDEQVDVKWITETEFNSDYFLVQRSKDGYVFQDVQKVPAWGNSSTHKKYSCTDDNPYEGISYYRLKQYDQNGTYFYSNLVVTEFHSKNSIAIYPNPSSGDFNVKTNGVKPGNLISVLVKDVLGKEIYSQEQIAVDENEVLSSQSFRTFLPGVYIVLVTFNNKSYHSKIVVK
ncbi:MAG TPA: T9SS type A sorting domain-containing protein, partial [Bacteroidia bacterium]|nr:T9SS type A sorting domain-containing protein [Bacteroidia bacterium]